MFNDKVTVKLFVVDTALVAVVQTLLVAVQAVLNT